MKLGLPPKDATSSITPEIASFPFTLYFFGFLVSFYLSAMAAGIPVVRHFEVHGIDLSAF